ncbi:phage tail terminator family protein [Paenibacillus sp. 481]|uniref:phage tail terminator family protein n=1 Tax=Paenibacillus sp. 481 TaxID=2835869 RepID=UPI001E5E5318|nr:hypothetical protein [Paenibacillus sp. 481]UHA72292.1 hypothetical protein KIK04_16600 [Paenibacillus sp. 481]
MRTRDLRQAIVAKLRGSFPAIPVLDVEERGTAAAPCFTVKLVQGERKRIGERRYEARLAWEISYHPKLMDVAVHDIADELYDHMERVQVGTSACVGVSMRHQVMEGALRFYVQHDVTIVRSTEQAVKMKVMKQEGRVRDGVV